MGKWMMYSLFTKIKIFEHKEGEPIKVFIGFTNHFTTNLVRQKLDRSRLGQTRINIRAIFSQSTTLEEIQEPVPEAYGLRRNSACNPT